MFNLRAKLPTRAKKFEDSFDEKNTEVEEQSNSQAQEESVRVVPRTTYKFGNVVYEEIKLDAEDNFNLLPYAILMVVVGLFVTSNNKININNIINTLTNQQTKEANGEKVKKPTNNNVDFDKMSDEEFFEYMAPFAIESRDKYGIYPSVTLAQAACESGFGRDPEGKNPLPSKYNNFFGVKATSETNEYWDGERVTLHTPNDGQPYNDFRVYKTIEDSFGDHARILGTLDRYKPAIEAYINGKGPQEQARQIANGGYAEAKNYAETLYNNYIKPYNLEKYDNMQLEDSNKSKNSVVINVEDTTKTAFGEILVYDEKSKHYIMAEEPEL